MLRTLLLFLLLPVVATATVLPEKLATDFAPIDGVVVLATPGQILIDRDAASGVVVGDLFAVLTPGAPILHPTSGAILGSSQRVSGWLRIAGVRSGYSEATLLPESSAASIGVKISRFAEAEALLIDAPGSAADLYPQLQNTLPQLRWLGYFTDAGSLPAQTATPRLLFSASNNTLEVREERSGLLRRYPLALPAAVVTAVAPAPVTSSYWNGPLHNGVARGLEIADLDGDGRVETIIATHHGIEIGRFSGKEYQKLAELNLGLSLNILAVDAFDSDSDGKMELWVTANRETELDSLVLLWDGKSTITRGAEHLNWWLRAITLPGAGRTLLAQKMGGEDFSGEIMHIALHNGQIKTAPAALPATLTLYGLARLGTPDNPLSVQLNAYDNLVIRAENGEVLQESDEIYGGSEAYLPRLDPLRYSNDQEIRHVYPPPRLEMVSSKTLLAPANIGSRTFKRQRLFKESRLDLLQWDGAQLRPLISGRVEKGYLVDYRYADIDNDGVKELASLLVTARPGLTSKGRYLIVVNETVLPE
ncbi:MAG: VCBS repeat-containing protein [Desulfuromonadales bacterium]|nr:VCBS repeat-containing protein [Desulfuromonadales bacterium]